MWKYDDSQNLITGFANFEILYYYERMFRQVF